MENPNVKIYVLIAKWLLIFFFIKCVYNVCVCVFVLCVCVCVCQCGCVCVCVDFWQLEERMTRFGRLENSEWSSSKFGTVVFRREKIFLISLIFKKALNQTVSVTENYFRIRELFQFYFTDKFFGVQAIYCSKRYFTTLLE